MQYCEFIAQIKRGIVGVCAVVIRHAPSLNSRIEFRVGPSECTFAPCGAYANKRIFFVKRVNPLF